MSQVGERYAQAFLSLAEEENKVALLKKEAEQVLSSLGHDVLRFFQSNYVTKEVKKELIQEAYASADKVLRNLLCLLVDSGRSYYLSDVLKQFIAQANKALHIQEVKIVSARPLQEEEVQMICAAIEKKLNKHVVVNVQLDKSLLAGTRIYINDRVYDSSLKAKIAHLKEDLLKESW